MNTGFVRPAVATVLTACGIETLDILQYQLVNLFLVETVLTVYGIETHQNLFRSTLAL